MDSAAPTSLAVSGRKKKKELGYGTAFPAHLLEERRFELRYKETARKVGLIVSRSLLVISMYSSVFAGKLVNGDFITHFNDKPVVKKDEVYDQLELHLRNHQEFSISVKRPRYVVPTKTVPTGYDIAPGYAYFLGLIVMYPNSTLGLHIKAFNNRIYVVRVEGDCMAAQTCLVGDCLVDVDSVPITTISDCSDRIIKGLKEKKHVHITIERATTEPTMRAVRCALFAEKTTPMDPRLATDTQKIGEDEAGRIRNDRVPHAPKGILKTAPRKETKSTDLKKTKLDLLPTSEEFTIGCEPYNPLFYKKVKKKNNAENPGTPSATLSGSSTAASKELQEPSSSAKKETPKGTTVGTKDSFAREDVSKSVKKRSNVKASKKEPAPTATPVDPGVKKEADVSTVTGDDQTTGPASSARVTDQIPSDFETNKEKAPSSSRTPAPSQATPEKEKKSLQQLANQFLKMKANAAKPSKKENQE